MDNIEDTVKARDAFHKKRDELKEKIAQHQTQITEHNQQAGKLEEEIDNSRPFVEGCDSSIKCDNCDIYSMKFVGSTPEPDRENFYKCVICNHEQKYV